MDLGQKAPLFDLNQIQNKRDAYLFLRTFLDINMTLRTNSKVIGGEFFELYLFLWRVNIPILVTKCQLLRWIIF